MGGIRRNPGQIQTVNTLRTRSHIPDLKVQLNLSMIVDVNTCSPTELLTLDGIDSKLASRIIKGRPYICLNQLLDIQGASEMLLKSLELQGLWVDHIPKKKTRDYSYIWINKIYRRRNCGDSW